MNKILAIFALLVIPAAAVFAEEQIKDENRSFYTGNVYYEKKDYAKALENYRAALDMGLESGSLYYNMGNAYLKMGKTGYAVLFYEKAMRLIPQDGDLKSNMVYAKAFGSGDSLPQPSGFAAVIDFIKSPFKDLNLNAVAIIALGVYLAVIVIGILFLLTPFLVKRLKAPLILLAIILVWIGIVFGVRYYEEEVLKKGVCVVKSADAKYEPIESSTVYYKISEGAEVTVLSTRDGWRHIRRSDGKSAWVKEDTVEEI